MPAPKLIATVCTANICRSPVAEALLGHALQAEAEPLRSCRVVSAGTLSFTYKRAVATGLTCVAQTITDLTTPASWSPTGVTQGTPDVKGNTTATIPYSTGTRYLRLSVTLNP